MRDGAAEINCKPRLSAEPTLAATETNCAARRTSPNDGQTSVAVATRLPPRRLMDNYSSQPGLTARFFTAIYSSEFSTIYSYINLN